MDKEPVVTFGSLLPLNVKKLFNNTYWSNFRTDDVDTKEEVIQLGKNRELIANKYELESTPSYTSQPFYVRNEFQLKDKKGYPIADHMEVYKNKNNQWVVIMSPYVCLEGSEKYQAFIDNGYTQIENIYSYDSTSFIKVYPKRKGKGSSF